MFRDKFKYIMLCSCLLFFGFVSKAQELEQTQLNQNVLTLNDILNLAHENSLEAFKAKRKYGVGYWEYRAFKSSLLPKIDLNLRPLTYNKSFVQRYDSDQNIDVYRSQQNLNSYANISATQDIGSTGTNLFINSNFNRLENFGLIENESYNVTPFSVGLIQPIMAFNRFKWDKKIAPLKYEKAKKDFIYEQQTINIKALQLFFNWALASKKLDIAKENKATIENLFNIGKRRYDIGSIEKDDVLNLELDLYNANITLTQSEQELDKSLSELELFLREDLPSNIVPELPELISNLQIDADKAIEYAYTNNPDFINLRLRKTEALRDLDQAVKENRFDLSVTASYGLNQQANVLNNVYRDFLDQQMVAIQFSVPILDWGERRGNIQTAKMNKEVADIEIQQDEDTYKQSIALKVNNFNLQKELVIGALHTSDISNESYKITEKRFLSGQVDLLNLSSSRKAWQQSTESYIQSLQVYWTLYYELQQLTLYNFINNSTLKQDFDTVLD